MNRGLYFLFLLLIIFAGFFLWQRCASTSKIQIDDDRNALESQFPEIIHENSTTEFQFVEPIITDFVLDYKGFVLEFDTLNRNARWVAYMLCRERLGDGVERAGSFRMEQRLGAFSPRDAEYRNTGYDRGHLAPAADMGWDEVCMRESFILSNVSPQVPAFNRGIWKRLEEQVRKFALAHDTIFVVTGPILVDELPKLGNSKIAIPNLFYKAVLKISGNQAMGIAFVLPNERGEGNLSNFAISIDSLEILSGLNFFPQLNPQQSHDAESLIKLEFWNLN
jgi:endonuclease G